MEHRTPLISTVPSRSCTSTQVPVPVVIAIGLKPTSAKSAVRKTCATALLHLRALHPVASQVRPRP